MLDEISTLTFDDIEIGQKKTFTIIISESLVSDFAKISGDYSPIHMDEDYVVLTPFKKRICHGMLLASFFSQLVGMYLPGKHALYFSQSLKFVSPCFIGDEVQILGEVTDKSMATKIITLKTTILHTSGKHIIDGEAKVLMRK